LYIAFVFMLSLRSQQLVGGFNRREPKAYARIREKYYARTYALVSRFTENSIATEELVCEVFIKLYYSKVRFESMKKIKDFIYVTSKNDCVNHMKKQKKDEADSENAISYYMRTLGDSREADEALASFKERVYKIANDFPRQMQNIFVLWLKEGLTNEEIAGRLEISEKTVGNQISKAKTKLKFEISKKGGRDLFLLNLIL
jgi:RNA polymerase sigma factor (sigma-70 family)